MYVCVKASYNDCVDCFWGLVNKASEVLPCPLSDSVIVGVIMGHVCRCDYKWVPMHVQLHSNQIARYLSVVVPVFVHVDFCNIVVLPSVLSRCLWMRTQKYIPSSPRSMSQVFWFPGNTLYQLRFSPFVYWSLLFRLGLSSPLHWRWQLLLYHTSTSFCWYRVPCLCLVSFVCY